MNTSTTHTSEMAGQEAPSAQELHQKRSGRKASEVIEQATGELVYIPLSKLVASAFNARRSGGEGVTELAALIKSQGLLQNLIVIPHTTAKGKPTAKFGVVAGGRRLRALNRLVEAGDLPAHEEILCKLTTKEQAIAAGVAENSGRESMSVADTVQSFATMIAAGAGIEDVAVCFGITPLTVHRRLKLANVSPRLFELFRQEEMNLDQLMALAINDDQEAQERVWDGTADWERSASNLRRQLLGREIDAAHDAVAQFVGVSAYEAAGGVVLRDLFDEEGAGYIADAELLHRLAVEKLAGEGDKLRAEGWAWVEERTSFDYSERHRFLDAPMGTRKPTAKEQAKLDLYDKQRQEAEEALEALYQTESDVDQDKAQALEDKATKAEAAFDNLHNRLSQWTPEVMAFAGAVVAIDHGGKLSVYRGLVRPEDKKQAASAVAASGTGAIRTKSGSLVAVGPKAAHSEALVRKLTAHRTKALQVLVAGNTQVALAALAHTLVQQVVMEHCYRTDSCLSVKANDCDSELTRSADDMKASRAWIELQRQLEGWRERIPGNSGELLPWLIEQPQNAVLELLALCTAMSINTVMAREADHSSDELATAVGLGMADWWDATASSYLSQVSKDQIVKVVGEAVSAEAATPLAKLKKAEAVVKAEALLTGTRWLPTLLNQRHGGD